MIVVGIVALIISFIGYYKQIQKQCRANIFIIPVIYISIVTSIIYLAGLLNILLLSVWFITILGIIYFLKNLKYKISISKKSILPLIVVIVIVTYLIYFCIGGIYADGDTLTHWGRIVRDMCTDNMFPNFETKDITVYQSYPPASACWIYYFNSLVGYSEATSMFAQGLWIVAGCISIFSLSKKIFSDLIIAIFSILILFINGSVDTLMVDTLLGVITFSALVIMGQKSLEKRYTLVIPFLIVIPTIKNSGILFAIFVLLYILVIKEKEEKLNIRKSLAYISIPIASLLLWQAHIKMVYSNAENTRHSLSTKSMLEVASGRPFTSMRTIVHNFINRWFSFNSSFEWEIIITGILLIVIIIIFNRNRFELKKYIYIVFIYSIYKIMLLLMYMFNMPDGSAYYIVSYERYQLTLNIILLFFIVNIFIELIESDKRSGLVAGIIVAILSVYITTKAGLINIIIRPDYSYGGVHRTYSMYIKENPYLYKSSVCIYINDTFMPMLYAEYSFGNENCTTTNSADEIEDIIKTNDSRFKYVLIYDQTEEIKQVLIELGYSEETRIIVL